MNKGFKDGFDDYSLSETEYHKRLNKIKVNIDKRKTQYKTEARNALRRETAKLIERAYVNATKKIKKTEFISSKHFAVGLLGLINDAYHTLFEHAKQTLQAPLVKEYIKYELGDENKTIVDVLAQQIANEQPYEAREFKKEFNKLEKQLEIYEKLVENLAVYAFKNGKNVDKVLSSTKNTLEIIKKTYGSFSEYERITKEESTYLTKRISELLDRLEQTVINETKQNNHPLEEIKDYVKSQLNQEIIEETRIDLEALGKIGKTYIQDIVNFGKVFIKEYEKVKKIRCSEHIHWLKPVALSSSLIANFLTQKRLHLRIKIRSFRLILSKKCRFRKTQKSNAEI